MKDSIYGVAFLLRKTGLSLAEIRGLEPAQFRELFEEVAYQEEVAEYQTASYVASLLAAIANTVPRKVNKTYKVSDFLQADRPRRAGEAPTKKEELTALAERFGIKLPAREILEL